MWLLIKNKNKNKMQTLIESLLHLILAIILPVNLYIFLIGGFILFSTVLGIFADIKQKNKFSFPKLINSLFMKMFMYTTTIISVYYLDKIILNEFIMKVITIDMAITKIATGIVLSKEFISINKNFGILTGTTLVERFTETFNFTKKIKDKYDKF